MATSLAVMATIKSARPSFRNNHDKVAFAVHAFFLSSGFDLTATGRPAFADDALSSSPTQEVGIDGWNEFDGEYAFVYTNPEKGSKKVLVKCLAIADKLAVDAIADGETDPAHLEIVVGNYAEEPLEGNYAAQYKNLGKLVTDLKNEILDKLYGGVKPVSSRDQSSSETNEEPGYYEGRPFPLGPQFHPSGVVIPPIPVGGGYGDLLPGPGAGVYPVRGGFGDGSMLVGPGDPRFGNQPDYMGPPQPGVPPPGARFDPFGPPGVPGFEPGRFGRRPGGGGMHPDLEHFPGGGSDFI
jgi:proteasome inhibitor subunit 1 (PI31)